MKFLRQYKGQLIFTLILFVMILIMPFQDYTERTFLLDEMNYPEESVGIVREDNGSLVIPDNAGAVTLNSNSYYFKKGSYEVTFDVLSSGEGNTVEVYDPNYLNPDNTCGKVLVSARIPVSGENIHLSFSIDDYVESVQFRVLTTGAAQFNSIYLLSQKGLYRDPAIYACLLLLASAILLFVRSRRRIRPEVLFLLAFAALWSSIPLCFTWLLKGHDMFFHYGRLFNLSEGLLSGSFPVRIHTLMYRGFTYMSPVFYSEFFLYPFAVLGIWGLSPIGCYKLLLVCVNFATAGVSYYSFSRLCRSRKLGLIASFLYTLSMYRMINLYTRAAVGEVLAAIFLPLLMLGMYQLFLGDSGKWLTAVLAFTGLFQSHMITTELSIGFAVLFGLLNIRRLKDRKRLLRLLMAAGTTILLNLWFIVPFLDHMRYSVNALSDVRNLAGYSLYASQIFDAGANNPAGDALGRGSITGEMSYSIGIVLLIGVLLFLVGAYRKRRKDFHFKLGCFCLGLGALSIYASSIYFPWEALQRIELINRLAGNIQFAFRFLPFASLFLSLTCAIGIYGFFKSKEAKELLFILCGVLTIYSSGVYFSNFTNEAETYANWDDQMDYVMDTDALYLISNNGEYFSVRKMNLQDVSFTCSEQVELTDCFRKGTAASFTYTRTEASSDACVDVPFNYYPYFHAYDSAGNRLETGHGELLRLRVYLPESASDTITIRFELPGYYRIGDVISLLTLLLLIAGLLAVRRRRLHRED